MEDNSNKRFKRPIATRPPLPNDRENSDVILPTPGDDAYEQKEKARQQHPYPPT